ncbi:MAG TPA: hypothetical protein PK033_16085 [Acetivibrio sp.]|nr:hypothetical protein [Acetivibrio sp.]
MKPFKFYFLLVALFSNSPSFSQIGIGPIEESHVNISELKVLNDCFLTGIDSLILKSDCPNLKIESNRYFFVQFNNLFEHKDTIYVKFELLNTPLAGEATLGYFKFKNYIFFINGNPPYYLFEKTEKSRRFTIRKGKFFITEEYPLWYFLYRNKSLELIEKVCWD